MVVGKKDRLTVEALLITKMEIDMKATSRMARKTDAEFSPKQMVTSMKVTICKARCMDKDFTILVMATNTVVII